MAKYDRRILLPYLQDLYSMELLSLIHQKEYRKLTQIIEELEASLDNDMKPEEQVLSSGKAMVILCSMVMVFCVASIFFAVLSRLLKNTLWVLSLTFAAGAAVSMVPLIGKWREYRENRGKYDRYCMEIMDYKSRAPEREKHKKRIGEAKQRLAALSERIAQVHSMKISLYGVGVIPSYYRNIRAVRFLFEYFNSSKADDVDVILQTFAVEELKGKRDSLSARQVSMILRHRVSLAEQVMSNTLQRQNYESQMRQIAALEQREDMRNQYLKMIDCDLQVSNYFMQCEAE